MYKLNIKMKLDTEEKFENDFIDDLTKILNDVVEYLCKVSLREYAKRQKLKKWVKEHTRNVIPTKIILEKMSELEVEDEQI